MPALDQEAPERVAATQRTPEPLQGAGHLHRPHELPDVDVSSLAQHLAEQLIASGTVRTCEDLLQLPDRDVLVPQEVRAQVSSGHIGRQRPHRRKYTCLMSIQEIERSRHPTTRGRAAHRPSLDVRAGAAGSAPRRLPGARQRREHVGDDDG